jgi:hypothetical protein
VHILNVSKQQFLLLLLFLRIAGAAQVVTKALTGVQRPNYYDPVTGKNRFAFHERFYRFKKDEN